MSGETSSAKHSIQFYDHSIPRLPGGEYTIQVRHELEIKVPASTSHPNPEVVKQQFSSSRKLQVIAPQFSLATADIHAVYPPSESRGDYSEILPQVVFSQRQLPWLRRISPDIERNLPWFALLLFKKGELLSGDEASGSINATIRQFLTPATDTLVPDVKPDSDVNLADSCRYLEISPETFAKLVPPLHDLQYSVHCRTVDMTGKAISEANQTGNFAVAIGTRLPQSSQETTYLAHLVSLEGLAPYLKDRDRVRSFQKIRLISLTHWRFTSVANLGGDLREALKLLIQNREKQLWLRLYPKTPDAGDAAKAVEKRLECGYVPLPYHLRSGENSWAWYRGPLTPLPVSPFTHSKTFSAVAAAMIYDQNNGIFDLSLATAWQMGQSLALADKNFGLALRQFLQKGHQLIDILFNRAQNQPETALKNLQDWTTRTAFTQLLSNPDFSSQNIKNIANDLPRADQLSLKAKSENAEADYRQNLNGFYDRAGLPELLQEELQTELETITAWLSELFLLYKIPYNHLIADPGLLPSETIRFFYVDPNWLTALIDGALATTLQSSRDQRLYQLIRSKLDQEIYRQSGSYRKAKQGQSQSGDNPKPEQSVFSISGCLLRSSAVTNWPGLEVTVLDDQLKPLNILRMDHLNSEILLIMYEGTPRRLLLKEPAEGVCLAINKNMSLHRITGAASGEKIGEYSPASSINPDGIINLDELVSGLKTALEKVLPDETIHLGPAALAMQLLKIPQQFMIDAQEG